MAWLGGLLSFNLLSHYINTAGSPGVVLPLFLMDLFSSVNDHAAEVVCLLVVAVPGNPHLIAPYSTSYCSNLRSHSFTTKWFALEYSQYVAMVRCRHC